MSPAAVPPPSVDCRARGSPAFRAFGDAASTVMPDPTRPLREELEVAQDGRQVVVEVAEGMVAALE